MVIRLYIAFICYIPILGIYLPRTNFGLGIPDIGHVRLTFYLLVLAFVIESSIRGIKVFSKWTVILSLYSVIVFTSVVWSNYSYSRSTFQVLFDSVFVLFCIAIIALNLFREKDNIHLYIKHISIASFILSLISICQMIFGQATANEELRSTATLGNPNALAIVLVLAIPCLLYGIEKKIISKKIGWLVTASVIGSIISTVSRKGIVTMALAFFLYFLLKKQYKKVILLGSGFAFLAIILSGYAVISHRFTSKELQYQFVGKANMAYAGLKMFQTSPIIGLGYRGYYENFGKYFPHSRVKKYDAHNIFITALANYGILGFIPFMGIFLYPLIVSGRILCQDRKVPNQRHLKDMAIICITSVLPFMISGYFAGGLFFYGQVEVALLYTHISFVLSLNTDVNERILS